jgi:hypothetical protein
VDSPCDADDPILVEAGVEQRSIRTDVREHVDRHKWIVSQKAGRDLGQDAVNEWIQQHWYDYLKARWLEHLQGLSYWIELKRDAFGVLRKEFPSQEQLINQIMDRMKGGCENLEIICWALSERLPLEQVRGILNVIDVNSLRLYHFFSTV